MSCGPYRIFLEFEVRRVDCKNCQAVKREALDFLSDSPFYTKRFAYTVGRRCRTSTISDVAKELHLDWDSVKALDKQSMKVQLAKAGTPGPKRIGIDEISIKKRHVYPSDHRIRRFPSHPQALLHGERQGPRLQRPLRGTGWTGLASINLDSSGHITQGTAKMNDFYSMSADFRNHVMCQEVGHTFGLGHTSEDGSTQNTCMDYSNSPTSTRPNQHDYEQLVSMYGHLDSYNSYSTSAAMPTTKSPVGDMGWRIRKGVFDETWVSPDGEGGLWVHHVYLAPGHEHTELLDGE